ncbi:MAG: ArnT family glycosyltransferase, partial [Vulcanococcus sp.]
MFIWDLGGIGLVDETPPLFAASARGLAESGDWLIPQVNGLPRYDKPPLVYWLMAALYRLPGQARWDALGSWSAGLPSALASAGTLLLVCLMTAWWERRVLARPQGLWLVAGLLFGLSPLVLLWSRIGVSDSLLTALVALAMLSSWWSCHSTRVPWWLCWLALGLATLTKGPVALVLFGLAWAGCTLLDRNPAQFGRGLQPLRGLLITVVVAAPWYGAALWREGSAFAQSFFGYHNLQRFTGVVNNHLQP